MEEVKVQHVMMGEINVVSAYSCKERTKHSCKTKNMKAHKNFNNCIENKEVKSLDNWVCMNILIWN